MKVEATVDVGQNLTSLLERLAQQIGTTADKVFPWYVQQAQIEGTVFLVLIGMALLLSVVAVAYGIVKGEWQHGDPSNLAAAFTIVGGACLVVSTVFALIGTPKAVTKVFNPQFHAMQMLTNDIGNITRR